MEDCDDSRVILLGCGILENEVKWLINKNQWPVDTFFLNSALHVDLTALGKALAKALADYSERQTIVFYGACHPSIDTMLIQANTFRVNGQNCVEMLLGYDLFTAELSKGAFFLLEDWARNWDSTIVKTFGDNPLIVKEIFQLDRKYLLCLRTPCSDNFETQAEEVGLKVGLPIRWLDVSLEHLELVLQAAIIRKGGDLL